MLTGFAGALYAHYTSVVTPKILGNEFILLIIVMMAIGGIGRFPGAVLGAFVITILNELLRDAGTIWDRLKRPDAGRRNRATPPEAKGPRPRMET